jgi:hypothetical protein
VNPGNIAALAAGAGFTGNDIDTAVAIALAESSGDPGKYNDERDAPGGTPPGQGSYGLWQIYLKKHPQFAGVNLLDPMTNAYAAFDVYSREGFHAWTTYNSGKYRAYLPAPSPMPQPPLTIDAATGLPDTESLYAEAMAPPPGQSDSGPSFGTVILWGIVGFFALWIFEEAS